jgi:hypothetical protein
MESAHHAVSSRDGLYTFADLDDFTGCIAGGNEAGDGFTGVAAERDGVKDTAGTRTSTRRSAASDRFPRALLKSSRRPKLSNRYALILGSRRLALWPFSWHGRHAPTTGTGRFANSAASHAARLAINAACHHAMDYFDLIPKRVAEIAR